MSDVDNSDTLRTYHCPHSHESWSDSWEGRVDALMGDYDTKLLTLWTRGSICYISVVSMDKFMLMFGCAFLDIFFLFTGTLGTISCLYCFVFYNFLYIVREIPDSCIVGPGVAENLVSYLGVVS